VDEIADLSGQGYERIQFVDSVFTNPPSHARAICEKILRRGVKARWSATVNPAFASPDLLKLMQRAGCRLVMVGNESGCSRTLDSLGKGFSPEAVERCFVACEDAGLAVNAFLRFGAPGEDRESVQESVDLVLRHAPAHVSVSVGIRLYPGCGLTERAHAEGELPADAGLLTPRFYLAPGVDDWIWGYLEPLMASHPNWTF
jgi:radical SAM superfamily enzyme YgiQ (UPF0313 family)